MHAAAIRPPLCCDTCTKSSGRAGNPLTGAGNAPTALAIHFEPSWVEYLPHWLSVGVSAATLGITIAKLWKGGKAAADFVDLEAGLG